MSRPDAPSNDRIRDVIERRMTSTTPQREGEMSTNDSSSNDAANNEPKVSPMPSRFNKRRSGKDKRRPKERLNLKSELAKIYAAPVTIKKAGKRRRMAGIVALANIELQRAFTSDPRATEAVFKRAKDLGIFAPIEPCGSQNPQAKNTTFVLDPVFLARVYKLALREAVSRLSDEQIKERLIEVRAHIEAENTMH